MNRNRNREEMIASLPLQVCTCVKKDRKKERKKEKKELS